MLYQCETCEYHEVLKVRDLRGRDKKFALRNICKHDAATVVSENDKTHLLEYEPTACVFMRTGSECGQRGLLHSSYTTQ